MITWSGEKRGKPTTPTEPALMPYAVVQSGVAGVRLQWPSAPTG